ncbi:hypothetical protein BDW74DRAFT_170335 [Aspergillus multicolor]|uniref:Hsp70 family protein n=1 Tax=Aspergillus multicolor TaxID=41759 RepID=UPI003CCDE9F8
MHMINQEWPEAMKWSYDQVPRRLGIPCVVYYDAHATEIFGWAGRQDGVVTERNTLKPGVFAAANFISRLYPPDDYPDEWKSALLPGTKTAENVTVDYLRHLRASILQQIREKELSQGSQKTAEIQFVITVPAFWDNDARGQFREIVKRAGFDDVNHPTEETLTFISGPEAALFHASSLQIDLISVADNVFVLNCGSHTAEAATYTIESKSPLKIHRRTAVSVSSCGSAEVSRLFLNIAREKIDKAGFPKTGRTLGRMRLRAKRAFEKEVLYNDKFDAGRFDFDLPPEVQSDGNQNAFWVADLGVELSCPEADMVEGYMSFWKEEIWSPFDAVVERTMGLVREQMGAVEVLGEQINRCLLIGGFIKCPYYARNVEAGMASLGLKVVEHRDDGANLAMGAVWAAFSAPGP